MALKSGYKRTDVGIVPEDWVVSPLSQLTKKIYRGASPRPIDNPVWFDNNSEVGWVRISDISQSNRVLNETSQYLSQDGIKHSRFIPSDSIIMGICATIGKPIKTAIDSCIHDGFVVFDTPKVDKSFLYYLLKALEPKWSQKGQIGSQVNLNTGLINITKVILPQTIQEQTAIATALSNTDDWIESLERLLEKHKAIKQGVMQELLTGKKRLPNFTGGWVSCSILNTLSDSDGIKIGPFGSQLKKEFLLNYGTYRVYGQENIYENNFAIGNRYLSCKRYLQLKSCEIKPGDFLISSMGTVGKCAIAPLNMENGIMDSHLIRLRFNRKVSPQYILNLFSSEFDFLKSQTNKLSVGGIMDGLSTKIISSLYVSFPEDIEEQNAITQLISDLDKEIEVTENKLTKARQIKQGMMQELLTGRIRLI